MKRLPDIAGGALGVLFALVGLAVLLRLGPKPPVPPTGTPLAQFMAAFGPTGYFTFVKVFEVIGGVLCAIPRARNFGLLILGPIIVNILAFHVFIKNGEGIFAAPVVLVTVLFAYLLWVGRAAFRGLAN